MTPRASAALEIVLNRFIGREASALVECRRLAGRSIAFRARDGRLSLIIEFQLSGVRVAEDEGDADAVIAAPLAAMLKGVFGAIRNSANRRLTALTVEGDHLLVADFSALLATVGFDIEELLAPAFGGALSHRLVGLGRDIAKRRSKPTGSSHMPGSQGESAPDIAIASLEAARAQVGR
jgi:ubiquinone biosynthesis protein UbiJ